MFTSFINFFKKIGYSLGSSPWLAKSLIKHAGIAGKTNLQILELGGGNGQITEAIIKSMDASSHLISIEREKEYFASLKRFSKENITIVEGDAQNIKEYVGTESVDVIISTLPLGSLDKKTVNTILAESRKVLKDGGKFIQYQYWMANKRDVKNHFHIQNIALEPRNFTPAFIYICAK